MEMKLPAAIVVAALVLAFAYIGYREYEHARDIRDAKEIIETIGEQSRKALAPLQMPYVSTDPRIAAERRAAPQVDRARRRLADNQRCVGGVVVTVSGAVYTQTGERCSGGYSDVPLR
jgi:hypothetical protein